MPPLFALGNTDLTDILQKNRFYIDKTQFLADWWHIGSLVTLITRPRRFGKTLMINTVEQFFSLRFSNQPSVFKFLDVWRDTSLRKSAGKYPVVSLSFANIKGRDFESSRRLILRALMELGDKFPCLKDSNRLAEDELQFFRAFSTEVSDDIAQYYLYNLTKALYKHYGIRAIILIDEYDTPMHEAWLNGYWSELSKFIQPLLGLALKDNEYLERGLLTGITRIAKESIFSDLNHLDVITTVSDDYSTTFGFTENEVFAAMDRYGLSDRRSVKEWYDGFTFGHSHDIYNPWSILNYLKEKKFAPYWANTSSNALAGQLIREGSKKVKQDFERLLQGETIVTPLSESIVFQDLKSNTSSLWSLLLASGYLKIAGTAANQNYHLALTNREVREMFEGLIRRWFDDDNDSYADFVDTLLSNDVWAMNETMNTLTQSVFSFFDTNAEQPEKFYHGFVLGLLVTLKDRFIITSNRESGFGRYDVVLEPRDKAKDEAFILEFKIHRTGTLEDSLKLAHEQIRTKNYATDLLNRGIPKDRIRAYGLVFDGKKVLIG